MRPERWRPALVMALVVTASSLTMLTAGCGSGSDGADGAQGDGVTVTDDRFGGTYAVTSLTVDDEVTRLVVPVTAALDAEYGELQIDTGCNTLYGSFSLLDDGRAGVTVAGDSALTCTDAAQEQESGLRTALAEVDSWSETADGLALVGSDGAEVVLSR